MFARVNTFQGSPDAVEGLVRQAREHVIPSASQEAGYRGMLLLADRASGKSIAVTLWEDEAALRASEGSANKLRADTAAAGGVQVVSVERLEVLLDEPR
jgi:hypothetical protein